MKLALKIFFFIMLTSVIFEIGTRIFIGVNYSLKILSYDPYGQVDFDKIVNWVSLQNATSCALRPNIPTRNFIVNSHGFPGEEVSYAHPKNTYRVLLLGDSFAVGVVPYNLNFFEKFNKELQNFLAIRGGLQVQGINLGISCVGPAIYKKTMEVEGVLYKPDLVILSFFIGNDFTDDDANLKYVNSQVKNNTVYPPLLYKSKFLSVLINSIKMREYLASEEYKNSQAIADLYSAFDLSVGSEYDPLQPSFDSEEFLRIEAARLGVYREDSGVYGNFGNVMASIVRIKEVSESIGAKLIVMIIPDELQINRDLLRDATNYAGISPATLDINLPQKTLKIALTQNNIPFVDLLNPLDKKNEEVPVFQPRNTHINSFGNEVVAKTLIDYFKTKVDFFIRNEFIK